MNRTRQRGLLLNPFRFSSGGGDPNFSSVVLLLHGEGPDGSTTITDNSSSSKTVTAQGNAQIDTSQFKYGAASIQFDGSGDYLSSATHEDFRFGLADLTIEMFVRFNVVGVAGLMSSYSDANGGFIFSYTGTSLRTYAGGTTIDRSWTPSAGVWYHVAVCRASGVTRIFVDGVKLGADIADARNWTPSGANLTLQIGRTHTTTNDLNGWLDEVRVTKGVGRYTANFTPPAAAFPNS